MIGCCWCTTAKCYQDKDVVEYYTGGQGMGSAKVNASGGSFDNNAIDKGLIRSVVNGSEYSKRESGSRELPKGAARDERLIGHE